MPEKSCLDMRSFSYFRSLDTLGKLIDSLLAVLTEVNDLELPLFPVLFPAYRSSSLFEEL
jgi:hypothetical protein